MLGGPSSRRTWRRFLAGRPSSPSSRPSSPAPSCGGGLLRAACLLRGAFFAGSLLGGAAFFAGALLRRRLLAGAFFAGAAFLRGRRLLRGRLLRRGLLRRSRLLGRRLLRRRLLRRRRLLGGLLRRRASSRRGLLGGRRLLRRRGFLAALLRGRGLLRGASSRLRPAAFFVVAASPGVRGDALGARRQPPAAAAVLPASWLLLTEPSHAPLESRVAASSGRRTWPRRSRRTQPHLPRDRPHAHVPRRLCRAAPGPPVASPDAGRYPGWSRGRPALAHWTRPHGVDGTSSSEHSRAATWGRWEPRGVVRSEDHPRAAGRAPTRGAAGRPGSGQRREGSGAAATGRQGGWYRGTARDAGVSSLRPTTIVARPRRPRPSDPVSGTAPSRPQVDLPALEREVLAFWDEHEHLRQVAGAERDGAEPLDVLRGPADRQRPAGHPPRRGPRLQGRLPPVPDHAGLPRRAQGRLGLPRPARSSSPSRRSSASPASTTSRRTASRSSTPSAASPCCATSTCSRR